MNWTDAIDKAARQAKLQPEVVREAYRAYWVFIRETISNLPLKEDLNEEEFRKLRTTFNVQSLGKLAATWESVTRLKNQFKSRNDKDKED